METKLIFALFLVWGVCACIAIPAPQLHDTSLLLSKVHNDEFGAIKINMTCMDMWTCSEKGDDCKTDWLTNPLECLATNGSNCCAIGLFCISNACAVNNVDANCSKPSDCHFNPTAPGFCVNGTCQYIYGLGDTCDSTSDCVLPLNCTNSICSGASLGQACSDAIPCNFGMYCNGSSICVNDVPTGGSCSAGQTCAPGNICTSGNCTALFTVAEGGACTTTVQCEEDYVCSGGKCTEAVTSLSTCTANSDCSNGAQCICSYFVGEQYCLGDALFNPCTEQQEDLIECMSENNCTTLYDSPNSCVYSNCYSDLKKSYSCNCDASDDLTSSCFYNSYCGGFPVWAIIVIIIVAIVLVLAIVLLVFFMMRRRRVYDSI
jgi:hypothetical protein